MRDSAHLKKTIAERVAQDIEWSTSLKLTTKTLYFSQRVAENIG
jgi:hypothetical protein